MKKAYFSRFVLMILLLPSTTYIIAQINSAAFFSPDKTWIEGYTWCSFEGDCFAWSFRYKFDTIPIESGGKTYVRLIKAPTEFSEEWIDAEKLIRYEDGRVYLSDFIFASNQIIYDFNLVEGDTFHLGNEQVIHDLVVERVDTVALLNGESMKRWILLPQNDPSDPSEIFWLEGIGNLNGFLTNFLPWTSDAEWSTVLCVHWDDTLVYDSPDYGTCWLMTTSTSERRKIQVTVAPNPASAFIALSGVENNLNEVWIFDSFGKRIHQGIKEYVTLDEFPSGYYYAIVWLKDRTSRRIPFVKI